MSLMNTTANSQGRVEREEDTHVKSMLKTRE